jgi:hypothetical protein
VNVCDELDVGVGWIRSEFLERCSHALAVDGRVWLVDPLDGEGVEERVRALGEPAGVIQLLDRHARDCRTLAARLGIPHHEVPRAPVPGAPFELRVVRNGRAWREVALWWPERRVLVCADALGTARYFRVRGERLAVHPLLRPLPPRAAFEGLTPEHVLCGHGEGVHGDAAEPALREALATARQRIPSYLAGWVRRRVRSE